MMLAILSIGSASLGTNPRLAHASSGSPNIVLVMVDDQATNSFRRSYMPQTFSNIVDHGTLFKNGLAAPPDCCPDRAGVLTGQYPHNHGVFSDHHGYSHLVDPRNTLPVWLDRAGYRTGLIGKFLNKYRQVAGEAPAPGFDYWFEGAGTYYGYGISHDGVRLQYGTRRRDYSTDVLTRRARTFVRGSEPFFLWLAYNAPHIANRRFGHPRGIGACRGRMPEPPNAAAYRRFAQTQLPHSPAFNETKVADKPQRIRSLPLLNRSARDRIRRRWRCTLATMSQVDRDLGSLISELKASGELSHTLIIYVSDNGFFFGEHRVPNGKGLAYEPALRVPFAIREPGGRAAAPTKVADVVSNQDITSTILAYANAQPCPTAGDCRQLDGRSLLPLLDGSGDWPQDRGVLVEIKAAAKAECGCAYQAIRTKRYLYANWSTGEKELYDLQEDPAELRNVAGSAPHRAVQRQLALRLQSLLSCTGVSCE
jgi:arylsulfatase A-like enzyme